MDKKLNSLIKILVLIFSTVFFIGYIPFAPGTFASFAGCLFWLFFSKPVLYYPVVLFIIITGFIFSSLAQRNIFYKIDPPEIVIDEIGGILITYVSFRFSQDLKSIVLLITGFLFFRFFDILKIPPIRQVQKFKGGTGIMLDDILSGILSNVLLQIIRFLLF